MGAVGPGGPLALVDRSALAPVVARALGHGAVDVVDWTGDAVHGGYSTASVYRLAGNARTGEQLLPWSLILKVLRSEGRSGDPGDWRYWKREGLVFRSGLVDDLPAPLAAPRCFGVVEREDMVWLWLEELVDEAGRSWPIERFGRAGRHAGVFNGAYLAGRPIPAHPWLTRDMTRRWVQGHGGAMERLAAAREEPHARRYWPGDDAERALALWEGRDLLLDRLDRLPHVLGHGDFQPGNLFARTGADGRPVTVAVDWASTGLMPVGRELTHLVAMSLSVGHADPDRAPELDGVVFDAYVQGLRDAGWRGDPRLARLGFTATTALVGGLHPWGVVPHTAEQRARIEQAFGSYEDVMDRNTRARHFALGLAAEARALIDVLPGA